MTAAKRATAKRLSLDSVAMRLAKAESMPGLNLAEQAGQRRFGGSQASLASSTLTIATNPPPATSRDHGATGGKCDICKPSIGLPGWSRIILRREPLFK